MKGILGALFALGVSLAALGSARAEDLPRLIIEYGEPSGNDPSITAAHDVLVKYKALDELALFLSPLRLPTSLSIQAAECGALRRAYDENTKTVTICYESIARILGVIAQHGDQAEAYRRQVAIGAIVETLLHETAFALFDLYDVPIWGREEDAADRLSAFVMTQFGSGTALTTIIGAVQYLNWTAHPLTVQDFAAADSPEAQRFYDFLCVAVGADPVDFGGIANNVLPGSRLGFCFNNPFGTKTEFEEIRRAFDLRLMPYVDPEALIRARATDW